MHLTPIFLYLKNAPISDEVKSQLVKGGYIPIAVELMDDVKILQPVSSMAGDIITRCALEALSKTQSGTTVQNFGHHILEAAQKALKEEKK